MVRDATRATEDRLSAAAAPPDEQAEPPTSLGATLAALALTAAFLALKCFALHPQRVDEGIYFYDALRLSEGARLYRDIFFAHPPLHLAPLVALFHLGADSLVALKSVSQLAGAAQGLLAFFIARRALRSDLAGLVTCAMLLFAQDFLKATSYSTDISLAGAWLHGGALLLLRARPLRAGLCLGASTMTLLQTAPMVGVAVVAAVIARPRAWWRLLLGLALVLVPVHVYFTLSAGSAFIDQVYLYHLRKVAVEGRGLAQIGFLYADNIPLFVGGTLALLANLLPIDQRPTVRRLLLVALVAVVAQLVAMATRPTVFPFYFQPVFLPLALAVGWLVSLGLRLAARGQALAGRAIGAALAVAVLVGPTLLTSPITGLVSPKRAEQRRTYAQTYTWREAPFIGPLNALVQATLWSDGKREPGRDYWSVTEYLWNQSRWFDSCPAIVDEVVAATPATATIFGDSAAAPMVALMARRRIALDMADTNVQRFTSGVSPPAQVIAQLEAQGGPTLVLASGSAGLFSLPELRDYLARSYRPRRSFADGHGVPYTLYQRR